VAAHDRAAHRNRVWIAFGSILTTAWIAFGVVEGAGRFTSTIGQQIFAIQAWAAFVLAGCAMNHSFDSISREKRDGTLGLLFLTHLTGKDVVLGKLVTTISLYAFGALATLPVLTLPVILGGIQARQSFYLLIALANTALFSAAAGLLASAICVSRRRAASTATATVIFFLAALPITAFVMRHKGINIDLCMAVDLLSPLFSVRASQGALLGLQQYYYWLSASLVFAFSCLFLAAASFIVPRVWQEGERAPLMRRLRQRYAAWADATIPSRSPLGRALLDKNAYEWLAARRHAATIDAWTSLAIMLLLCAGLIAYFTRHYETSSVLIMVCLPAAYLVQINLKSRAGGEAVDRFCEDRDNNAIELILSTPLSIRDMIAGEFAALKRRFLPLFLVMIPLLFLAWFLCLGGIDRVAMVFNGDLDPIVYRARALVMTMALVFFLFVDSLALVWTGMLISLTIGKTAHARALTMLSTLLGPLALYGLLITLIRLTPLKPFTVSPDFYEVIGSITAVVFFVDLLLIGHARKRLYATAREKLSNPLVHTRDFTNPFAALKRLLPKAP